MSGILFQAFIYLAAAVVAVPLAKRLGLGSVLGYLIAGILIGPVIGLVGSETESVQHFAEFGVVMMLFIVGLELAPRSLWEMRMRLLGLGGLQVLLTGVLILGIAMLFGQSWQSSVAIGMVLSLSSTAIVLQTLNEKGLMKSEGGQSSFSVLLFQDIAVIPMLALIPLLAMPELMDAGASGGHSGGVDAGASAEGAGGDAHSAGDAHSSESGHGEEVSLIEGLAGWQIALVNVGAIATVVIGGMYLSRPLFQYIARADLREIFTVAALFVVVGIALLMSAVGLSPALGTFLAGVVLANSEYRHELESDIEPFKGLLLGLFFITVGAGIDFQVLFADIGVIVGLTLGLMLLKALVMLLLAVLFKVRGADRWMFVLSLAQAGEFGFVLISFCLQNNVLPDALAERLLLVVALSMLLTPLLFLLFEHVIEPRLSRDSQRAADEVTERGTAIIAGHGRFGQVVNRLLMSNGYETVVLDDQAEMIESLRAFGTEVFYGDASRPELLAAAGLDDARLLVVAIDRYDQALELIRHARRVRPDIHIIARAYDRLGVYQLYQSGTDDIVRETFDSSVRAGRYALEALGMHPFEAEKAATTYVNQDVKGVRRLAKVYRDDTPVAENQEYVSLAKDILVELERAMADRSQARHDHSERGWRPPGHSEIPDDR